MATLAPKLNSGVTFEQPVQAGNTVADNLAQLFTGIVRQENRNKPTERNLTEDERFQIDLRKWEEAQGISKGDSNYEQRMRGSQISLRRDMPQYTDQINSYLTGLGVTRETTPALVEQDRRARYDASEVGILTNAYNERLATNENNDYNEELHEQLNAESYVSHLQTSALVANTENSKAVWNAGKPRVEMFVEMAIADGLSELTQQIIMNGKYEVPPDNSLAALGIKYVDHTNITQVLERMKPFIKQGATDILVSEFGLDRKFLAMPDNAYWDEVLAPFDNLIRQAQVNFESMADALTSYESADQLAMNRFLKQDFPELYNASMVAKYFPEEFRSDIMTAIFSTDLSQKMQAVMSRLLVSGVNFEVTDQTITNLSDKDQTTLIQTAAKALTNNSQTPESLKQSLDVLMSAVTNRGNIAPWNGEQVDQYLTKHFFTIQQLMTEDPAFADRFNNFILSDIERSQDLLRSSLGSYSKFTSVGFDENGNVTVEITDLERAKEFATSLGLRETDDPELIRQRVEETFRKGNTDLISGFEAKMTIYNQSKIFNDILGPSSQATRMPIGSSSKSMPDDAAADARSTGATGKFSLPADVQQDTEFLQSVQNLGTKLNVPADWLLQVIGHETRWSFSPSQEAGKDEDGKKISTATGLIQFVEDTAKDLGYTLDELKAMTRVEQMVVVEKYLTSKLAKTSNPNFGDLYMAVFWPKAVGKSDDYVLFGAGTEYYRANNPGWKKGKFSTDLNGDGKVTRGEMIQVAGFKPDGSTSVNLGEAILPDPALGATTEAVQPPLRPDGTPEVPTQTLSTKGGVVDEEVIQEASVEAAQGNAEAEKASALIRIGSQGPQVMEWWRANLGDSNIKMIEGKGGKVEDVVQFPSLQEVKEAVDTGVLKKGEFVLLPNNEVMEAKGSIGRPATEKEFKKLSPEDKRAITNFAYTRDKLLFFNSDEEAEAALYEREIDVGDVYITPDNELRMVLVDG